MLAQATKLVEKGNSLHISQWKILRSTVAVILGIQTAQRASTYKFVRINDITFHNAASATVIFRKFKTGDVPKGIHLPLVNTGGSLDILKHWVKFLTSTGANCDQFLLLKLNADAKKSERSAIISDDTIRKDLYQLFSDTPTGHDCPGISGSVISSPTSTGTSVPPLVPSISHATQFCVSKAAQPTTSSTAQSSSSAGQNNTASNSSVQNHAAAGFAAACNSPEVTNTVNLRGSASILYDAVDESRSLSLLIGRWTNTKDKYYSQPDFDTIKLKVEHVWEYLKHGYLISIKADINLWPSPESGQCRKVHPQTIENLYKLIKNAHFIEKNKGFWKTKLKYTLQAFNRQQYNLNTHETMAQVGYILDYFKD